MKDTLRIRCEVRGWAFNNFTCYLLETGRTAGAVAVLLGCNLSATHYWLHQEKLTSAVNILFLLARKCRMQMKIDILDLL